MKLKKLTQYLKFLCLFNQYNKYSAINSIPTIESFMVPIENHCISYMKNIKYTCYCIIYIILKYQYCFKV